MTKAVECNCAVCNQPFTARVADRKRGWAKCCSKSCAAIKSNRETGKYEKLLSARAEGNDGDWEGGEWDAHKEVF